jgi:hypothetical protein
MRVKMLVCMVGPKIALDPGDEYICGDAEAARLVAAGYAAPVVSVPVAVAVAEVAPKLERAVKPKSREAR